MEYLNLISVPAIVTAVYLLIETIKKVANGSERLNCFIPLIALAIGAVSGVVCFYFIPSIIPAENIVVAIIIGGASGLSATGTNQIIKQLTKKNNDTTNTKE